MNAKTRTAMPTRKTQSAITSSAKSAIKLATFKNPIPTLAYQERWIQDDSQLKIAVWSRQSGKSFAAALRAVLKCLTSRTQYIILSKGERQSRLFMEKVRDFCAAFRELKILRDFEALPETDDKTMEVAFPNGSRIVGLPANPDTARGYTGHIVLDEFAFHGDAYKIFAACFPIITRGYSIEIISTPNGTAGKFYEIAKQAGLATRDSGLGIRRPRLESWGLTLKVRDRVFPRTEPRFPNPGAGPGTKWTSTTRSRRGCRPIWNCCARGATTKRSGGRSMAASLFPTR